MITTKELAEIMKVSTQTIWIWRDRGLPHYKLNARTIRYDLKEVMDWIKKEKGGTSSE